MNLETYIQWWGASIGESIYINRRKIIITSFGITVAFFSQRYNKEFANDLTCLKKLLSLSKNGIKFKLHRYIFFKALWNVIFKTI